ncbi:leucine-rich repeat-containing protein 45 [Anabas testudineus]|uniref:leucine-rich repeat-containing protein 45 n=1 Tax=Anabas testudineus TaxID=64144 RepID=UPI000E45F558|nr:leucine-rich repeat-containing protein 45 [Anabas testudineus]
MEDFRHTYLRLCKEGGVEPQEGVVAQLQEHRAAQGSRLDLNGQSLSVGTCSVLARAFQKDITFSEVSLSDCMLSEEGASVLLTGLFGNTTVKVLDLKGNNLRSTGAEVLGKLLESLLSLPVLTDLRWNNIGLLGGRSLLEALQKNKSVVKLEMAGNNIPSDTLKALERTTGHNSDRQSMMKESHSRTHVLSKEIQSLKEDKGRQFLSLMETIDRQREDMGRSNRSTSIHIGQLQEALNERKSAVNSLTAKLQMTEAALALSEQKIHNLGELLTQVKAEKEEQREWQSKVRKKEQEDSALREGKLLREIQNLTETNVLLKSKVEEMEQRCRSQQQQIFELKQELTNSTSELKLRLAQAQDRLEMEKRRSKQALEDMDSLRQKEVQHVNQQLEESERVLQERIFKLEGQRIQLEEELSKAKVACVAERAQAEEELGKVRTQVRLEEQEHVSALKEKLRLLRSSLQEVQLQGSLQKQTISELQAKNSQQSVEMDGLRRRIEELQQEMLGKDQEKVAEVSRVRLELQEQIGHLQAERTAQGALKEKIMALEREIKVLSSNHREALLDKESDMSSLLEKLRLKEAEIQRMREDEANRASYLHSAILTYVQGSPLGHYSSPKK